MRSTLWAIWLLVPDAFSDLTSPPESGRHPNPGSAETQQRPMTGFPRSRIARPTSEKNRRDDSDHCKTASYDNWKDHPQSADKPDK